MFTNVERWIKKLRDCWGQCHLPESCRHLDVYMHARSEVHPVRGVDTACSYRPVCVHLGGYACKRFHVLLGSYLHIPVCDWY